MKMNEDYFSTSPPSRTNVQVAGFGLFLEEDEELFEGQLAVLVRVDQRKDARCEVANGAAVGVVADVQVEFLRLREQNGRNFVEFVLVQESVPIFVDLKVRKPKYYY
jgi:hypothetical protein